MIQGKIAAGSPWLAAPQPELMPAPMHRPVAQGKIAAGSPWLAAPRPELLPGMGRPRTGVSGRAAQMRGPAGVVTSRVSDGQLRPFGDGRPLDPGIRARMEGLFGADFSGVRVHEGPAVQTMGALALTRGETLYFAPGHYDPTTRAGIGLLGHELMHVVQQREGRVLHPHGRGMAIVQDPELEAEAQAMGLCVAQNVWPGMGRAASGEPVIQRMDWALGIGLTTLAAGGIYGLGRYMNWWGAGRQGRRNVPRVAPRRSRTIRVPYEDPKSVDELRKRISKGDYPPTARTIGDKKDWAGRVMRRIYQSEKKSSKAVKTAMSRIKEYVADCEREVYVRRQYSDFYPSQPVRGRRPTPRRTKIKVKTRGTPTRTGATNTAPVHVPRVVLSFASDRVEQAFDRQDDDLRDDFLNMANYNRNGSPANGFRNGHFDNTGRGSWKVQADVRNMGRGTRMRAHYNAERQDNGDLHVEVVAVAEGH